MAFYVYALLDRAPRASLRGLAREALVFVPCGPGLVAAVGRMARPPAIDLEALRAHDRVVRRLAEAAPAVLPVRFGSVASDRAELAVLVRPRRAAWIAALALVRGRRQMTLRAFKAAEAAPPAAEDGPAGAAVAGAVALAKAGRSAERAGGPGARYLAARALQARAHERAPELDPWRSAVAPLVVSEQVDRSTASPQAGARAVTMHHLIDRRAVAAYKTALRRVGAVSGGVRVTVTGPWPPYAFAAAL